MTPKLISGRTITELYKYLQSNGGHTALTRLAAYCDVSTLQAIAGHSSLTMTQRYVHVQELAINETFERKLGHKIGHSIKKRRFKVVREKA